jgi:hypothetical protein
MKNRRQGQALVEAIVAIGVLSVGFLGIFTLVSQSLGLNRVVADNYTGTYLASEGIEVVKNIIDSNLIAGRAWNAGLANGDYEAQFDSTSLSANQNRKILFDPATRLYGYSAVAGIQTPFTRTIRIENLSANEIRVNSIARWTSRGGGNFDANVEDHFYNWR